ncbi:hypothetical protein DVH24_003598 [Malus domestica]|uniref:Uncharacterized protein n=1 Tax=Malus domestica TaxID=3750 RepID=A0A498IIR7_MALDO|nr:hypothetical protein DVH24_003598 [Malus domestica]
MNSPNCPPIPSFPWNDVHHVHASIIVEGLCFDSFLTFPLTLLQFAKPSIYFDLSHKPLCCQSLPSLALRSRLPSLTFLMKKTNPVEISPVLSSKTTNHNNQTPKKNLIRKAICFSLDLGFPFIPTLSKPLPWGVDQARVFSDALHVLHMGFLFKFLFCDFGGFVCTLGSCMWVFNLTAYGCLIRFCFQFQGTLDFLFLFWAFVIQGEQFQLLSLGLLWNQIFYFYDCES